MRLAEADAENRSSRHRTRMRPAEFLGGGDEEEMGIAAG